MPTFLNYEKPLLTAMIQCSTSDECIEKIKQETRRYAKRQLTWFKREPDVIMINKQDFNYDEDAVLEYMLDKINEKIMKK